MLVLSRRQGESIVIGDSVLTLLDTGRGRVRIGIEAPKDVSVIRAELRDTGQSPDTDQPPDRQRTIPR